MENGDLFRLPKVVEIERLFYTVKFPPRDHHYAKILESEFNVGVSLFYDVKFFWVFFEVIIMGRIAVY